jgi:hypothetical protein
MKENYQSVYEMMKFVIDFDIKSFRGLIEKILDEEHNSGLGYWLKLMYEEPEVMRMAMAMMDGADDV